MHSWQLAEIARMLASPASAIDVDLFVRQIESMRTDVAQGEAMQRWQKRAIKRLLRSDIKYPDFVSQAATICKYTLDKAQCAAVWQLLESRFANERGDWRLMFENIRIKENGSYVLIKKGLLDFQGSTWETYNGGSEQEPVSYGSISRPLGKKEKRRVMRQLIVSEQFHQVYCSQTRKNVAFAKTLWTRVKDLLQ